MGTSPSTLLTLSALVDGPEENDRNSKEHRAHLCFPCSLCSLYSLCCFPQGGSPMTGRDKMRGGTRGNHAKYKSRDRLVRVTPAAMPAATTMPMLPPMDYPPIDPGPPIDPADYPPDTWEAATLASR